MLARLWSGYTVIALVGFTIVLGAVIAGLIWPLKRNTMIADFAVWITGADT
jgi:hypothetical protein